MLTTVKSSRRAFSGAALSAGLVDRRRVEVRSGQGGAGHVSYIKHVSPKLFGPGVPAGGNGGRGGDVIFKADPNVISLTNVPRVARAMDGGKGRNRKISGKNASPLVVKVPLGVVVSTEPQEDGEKSVVLADLNKAEQSYIAAFGGAGGHGNVVLDHPHDFTVGDCGEVKHLILELKSIADVGLVGFPNAGKSSLLRALTKARPKIASYPFTTLAPHLGTLRFTDDQDGGYVIADLPGLVEGAHDNVGLGHQFLRHIQRTTALLYVVDGSLGADAALSTLRALQLEVKLYSGEMADRPFIVLVNKCDGL
ncbi:Spo0B-associated GTP-binding protein, putative, partial [Perkinsus marinus ATCC 50983]